MVRTGFDNEQYLSMQSQHILERIKQFGGKLYLEFGSGFMRRSQTTY